MTLPPEEGTPAQWALILGASSGFGAAAARRLASEGFHIVGVHRDRRQSLPAVNELRASIESSGRRALFFNANACVAETREKIIGTLAAELGLGAIHVCLHSIAFGVTRPLVGDGAATADDLALTMAAMGTDIVLWVQALLGAKLLASPGRVLALTSEGGRRALRSYGPVSAAKSALEANVRQLAVELAPLQITANCLLAGVCDTPAVRRIPGCEQLLEAAARRNPHSRLTCPEDVAAVVSLLCDPRAAWITGSIVHCDGGESIAA